jgi:tetratricopeptide (TPR) repeat protein
MALVLLFLGGAALVLRSIVLDSRRVREEREELAGLWNSGDYEAAWNLASQRLEEKPLDYNTLCIGGFAAFQLGMAQINTSDTVSYINSCIWSLRKALLCKETYYNSSIYYVLGKAYYAKGAGYEDEALHYLKAAQTDAETGIAHSSAPGDLNEYLGLAYAAVHDYHSSVAAFSVSLNKENSLDSKDRLFLAISRSYQELGEISTACAYLLQCMESSQDADIIREAGLRLGAIYMAEGRLDEAEAEYNALLLRCGAVAEAYYQLGLIAKGRGDTVAARSRFREALRTDPSHTGTRLELGL